MLDDYNNNNLNNGFNEQGKIGFESPAPVGPNGQPPERYQKNLPYKPLRIINKIIFAFGVVASLLTIMYYLLPIFSVLVGAILAIVIVLFMIVSVVFTLGIVLTIDEYRYWIGNHMMDVPTFCFDIANNIAKLEPIFPIIGFSAIGLCSLSLALSIFGQTQIKRYFVSYIVVNSIFLITSIFFVLVYFIGGAHILTNN